MTKRSDANCEAIWRIMSERLSEGQRPLVVREIGQRVGMSKTGTFYAIQRLVELGYVTRPDVLGGRYTIRVPLFPLLRDGADVLTPIPPLVKP